MATMMIALVLCPALPASAADDKPAPPPAGSIDKEIDERVPAPFASWSEFQDAQDRLDEVGAAILGAPDVTGYAGIVVSAVNGTLDLYWHGTVPAGVREVIASAPVRVHPAAYAETDLIAQAEKVAALPGVTQAGPVVDGSAVQIRVSDRAPQSTLDGIRSTLTVPYTVGSKETRGFDVAFNKTNDIAPYWGGARIVWKPKGTMCSDGFSIKIPGEPEKMLTAGHCMPWSNTFEVFTDGGGDTMGTGSHQAHFRDTMTIDAFSGAHMYTGHFDANTARPVRKALPSFVGDRVCRSSAFSNQTCNIEVVCVDQSVTASGGEGTWTVEPMVEAIQIDDHPATGNGDSGGAVFTFRTDGGVTARGIDSADDADEVPCSGVPTAPNRKCTTGLFYSDITLTLKFYKATLVTS